MKLLSILLIICVAKTIAQNCKLDIERDIKSTSPHLIKYKHEPGIHAFYLPDSTRSINIPANTIFYIACNDGKVVLNGVKQKYGEIDITCVKNNIFKVSNVQYKFDKITCTKPPTKSMQEGNICINSTPYKQLGYKLNNRFLDIINVCFDNVLKTPIYSVSEIDKNIDTVPCDRPLFSEAKQYNLPQTMDYYYNIDNQRATINRQIGLKDKDYTYINRVDDKYLVRGHLTAKTDFMYPAHQKCTFFYINSAPQWQFINNGIWKKTEKAVRDLAVARNINLEVVTGVYGILKLKNKSNGQLEDIYLYKDGNKKALPVPEFFWKFVYDKEYKAGVVLVASNNRIVGQMRNLCRINVCSQLTWIKVNPSFMYCCAYADFKSNFYDTIPNYTVNKILI